MNKSIIKSITAGVMASAVAISLTAHRSNINAVENQAENQTENFVQFLQVTPKFSRPYRMARVYKTNGKITKFEDEDGNIWAVSTEKRAFHSNADYMLIFGENNEIIGILTDYIEEN